MELSEFFDVIAILVAICLDFESDQCRNGYHKCSDVGSNFPHLASGILLVESERLFGENVDRNLRMLIANQAENLHVTIFNPVFAKLWVSEVAYRHWNHGVIAERFQCIQSTE